MSVGSKAGVVATIGYDLARLVGLVVSLKYTGFPLILEFGSLLLGPGANTVLAAAAGIVYHVLNGLLFAVMYSIVAGRARWYWALPWAMALEAGMILTYPRVFGVDFGLGSILLYVSLFGHAVYGVVLGSLVERNNI